MKAACALTLSLTLTAPALSWAGGGPEESSFTGCTGMFPDGTIPEQVSQTVQDLCKTLDGRAIFAIRYDTKRQIPIWTAHLLTPTQMEQINANAGTFNRPSFTPDPEIAGDDQAVDQSYVRSGFARGHIVPAGDMAWNKDAYDLTFHFSNVVPQKQKFNNGAWRGQEDEFREYVETKNAAMWVFSGVYGTVENDSQSADPEGPTIGKAPNTATVPKCYYKIVVTQGSTAGTYKTLATLYEWNDYGKRNSWPQSVTTLAQIEKRSGIQFLAGLAQESTFDAEYWGVNMPDTPADCQ